MRADELHPKVIEVEKFVAILRTEIDQHAKAIDDLYASVRELSRHAQEVRVRCETEFATVRQDRDEMRRWCEKNGTADIKTQIELLKERLQRLESLFEKVGNRAWSVVPNVVGALISGVIAALVVCHTLIVG